MGGHHRGGPAETPPAPPLRPQRGKTPKIRQKGGLGLPWRGGEGRSDPSSGQGPRGCERGGLGATPAGSPVPPALPPLCRPGLGGRAILVPVGPSGARQGYSLTTSVSIRLLPGLGDDMVAAAAPGAPGGLSAPPPPRAGAARRRAEWGNAGSRGAGSRRCRYRRCCRRCCRRCRRQGPPPAPLALPQPLRPPLPQPLSGPLTSPAVTSPPRGAAIGRALNAPPAPRHAGSCSSRRRCYDG